MKIKISSTGASDAMSVDNVKLGQLRRGTFSRRVETRN